MPVQDGGNEAFVQRAVGIQAHEIVGTAGAADFGESAAYEKFPVGQRNNGVHVLVEVGWGEGLVDGSVRQNPDQGRGVVAFSVEG